MATFRELLDDALAVVDEVDPSEAAELIAAGWVVLDVREPDEVAAGTIADSVHIPRGRLETSIETRLPRSTGIVAMCAAGTRSAFAAQTLRAMDYVDVVSLRGGFDGWKDQGRPWIAPRLLDTGQRVRYQRHLALPEIGESGQLRLLDAKVLCVGAGGLGSPAAMYLAAAGVGTLGIVDMDEVDESNLQRQILHNVSRVGERKVESARQTLTALNPDVSVVTHDVRLDATNIVDILRRYDIVVDGADNFPVRYLLNDASVKLGIPVVHGSIFRFEGQVSVFDPVAGPTYRDLVPEPPPAELAPSCAEAGVLGVLPGIIGSLQALEAIKLIVGHGSSLVGRLLVFDATDMTFSEFAIARDPDLEITYANRDRIEIIELDGACRPAPLS